MAETNFEVAGTALNSNMIKHLQFSNFVTDSAGFIILSKSKYPDIHTVVSVVTSRVDNSDYGYWAPPLSNDVNGNRFISRLMYFNNYADGTHTISTLDVFYI